MKVDVDKARVHFEADITNKELPEPNGINEPDSWEQKMTEHESDNVSMSI